MSFANDGSRLRPRRRPNLNQASLCIGALLLPALTKAMLSGSRPEGKKRSVRDRRPLWDEGGPYRCPCPPRQTLRPARIVPTYVKASTFSDRKPERRRARSVRRRVQIGSPWAIEPSPAPKMLENRSMRITVPVMQKAGGTLAGRRVAARAICSTVKAAIR